MTRAAPLGLLSAALAYLALRGLMLVTAFDESAMHMYEQYPMGTIPLLLLERVDVPLAYFYDNAGGQLLVGLLALPSYALLGPTYLALKLVPLALGLVALGVLWRLADEHFGRRAANLAAWLFALGPTLSVKYSLMASGNHYENLLFTVLAVWGFARLHRDGARPTARALFLAGFLAGLALFVFLGAITPLAICAALHVGLAGPRRALADLRFALPGFLVGALPLLLVNVATGGRGSAFLQTKFGGEGNLSPARMGERAASFLTEHLPDAAVSEGWLGLPGSWVDAAWLIAFAAAWLLTLPAALRALARVVSGVRGRPAPGPRAGRAALDLLLVAYLPLTTLAYAASDLRIGGHAPPLVVAGYRYFLPHFLFAALLVAARSDDLLARGPRWAGALLAGLALAAGVTDLGLVDGSFERAGEGFRYAGYNFHSASKALVGRVNELDDAEVALHADALPEPHRREIWEGVGFHRALRRTQRGPTPAAPDLDALLAEWPAQHRDEIARGVGLYLRELTHYVPAQGDAVRATLRGWKEDGHPALGDVAAGFCRPWDLLLASRSAERLRADADWHAALPELAEELARGRGLVCGELWARGIPSERALVRAVAADLRGSPAFLQGLGEGLVAAARSRGAARAALESVHELELDERSSAGVHEAARSSRPDLAL